MPNPRGSSSGCTIEATIVVIMSGDGSNDEASWYTFAYYKSSKLRFEGYQSFPLSAIVNVTKGAISPFVASLASKNIPYKRAKEKELETTVTVPPGPRFHVHFVGNPYLKESDESNAAKHMLKNFYLTNLETELSSCMNYGDNDKMFGPTQLIDSVLHHQCTYHILLTGCESDDLADGKSTTSTVPIAAFSFCSNEREEDRLFVSLFAVSSLSYTKGFGRSSDNKPWRLRGLGRFLFCVGQTFHRSLHHYKGNLLVLVCTPKISTSMQYLKKLGYLKVAHSFKDCFGFPLSDEISVSLLETHVPSLQHLPFLANEAVFGYSGE